MSNVFADVAGKIKTNKVVILFFLASLAMLLIGVNHFIEDTLSSLYGVQQLEQAFGINPATYDITYWTMSVAPQVAQMVFLYVFMVNTKKNRWALAIAIGAFLMDFFADAWYRSNGQFMTNPTSFVVASMLTFIYFTIGSELFLTIGLGLTLELLGPAISQTKDFVQSTMGHARQGGGGGGGGSRKRPNRAATPVRIPPGGFPEGHPLNDVRKG